MAELHIRKIRPVARTSASAQPIAVGRSSECDLVLPHRSVSRRHCVIETVDEVPRVRDLGSRTGTRLNGRPIEDAPLREGDRIGVGPYEITWVTTAQPDGGAMPDTAAPGPDETTVGEEIFPDVAAATEMLPAPVGAPRDEFAAEREALDTRAAELEVRAAELDDRQRALDDERERQDAARADLAAERTAVDAAQAALDAGRDAAAARAAGLEAELADERAAREDERDAAATAHAELLEQLEGHATDLAAAQRTAATLERERDETRGQLANAETLIAELTERIGDLGQAREGAVGGLDAARSILGGFRVHAEALVQAAVRYDRARETVEALDTRWLEFDELAEDGDPDDTTALAALEADRDALSGYLEAAHVARDDAARALHDAALRCGIAARSAVIPEVPPAPTEPEHVHGPRRRAAAGTRWWRWWPASRARSS